MIQSSFVTMIYTDNQVISLKGVTSLAVYNSGQCIVEINGKPIYPNQKEIVVVPDGTYSDVSLNVEFFEPKADSRITPAGEALRNPNTNPEPHDVQTKQPVIYKKTILLIYKKIS